ncbi:DUF362 domain-containing protein [Synoicihabitans lomoniglobus]|uniref:DUF362 domain-containing protein n=1 Tax=Synoicihabitans lomoniglobus TaxID=2909285 RepID=A0AAE9ZUU8_9BACT|nr:DUF362 domain-containing protein [Opitutaceae bacterium LMO-M01]WED63504.1 DUF362 domain-containing protein [Opitutaceae bacterium LMO-M01]
MPRIPAFVCAAFISALGVTASAQSASTDAAPSPIKLPSTVWEAKLEGFSFASYRPEVERLLEGFEKAVGHRLVPGEKGKVGLKIYADSGPGLATPVPLVQAVIAALQERGYRREDIFLVGLNPLRLRFTGYLPSLITGESPFEGHPIYILESGQFYDPEWFYDSPLPSRFDPVFLAERANRSEQQRLEENRRSFLATPLFLDADFWINLPVYTDHPTLGVNGALVNATLWNASNTARFMKSPTNAPAAVAEMSAIPELRQTWLFTIASLQQYQFVGGPAFNSLYTVSDHTMWLSADPVALDTLMLDRINFHRRKAGFPIVSEEIRTLEFAEVLDVGSSSNLPQRIVSVDG